ncbi:MAG: nucleoside 2-deoxyribosyltransferase [Marinobacter sp.]|nr:nucleoside 2-deoxyribosyltransferase [Marinobacter sp.]
MTTTKRIYLAGPEVFFPEDDHQAIVGAKKRILAEFGFEGIDPLDTALDFPEHQSRRVWGERIYRTNRHLMDRCDAIIANLTPFRGLSADPGTVFEVGYMVGQGKVAFGFSMDHRNYYQRAGARPQDDHGHTIEPFELVDNLMIECGIEESGGRIYTAEPGNQAAWFDDGVFTRCVKALAEP